MIIKRLRALGSTEEAFHESLEYFISREDAILIGKNAGLIAKGVKTKNNGFSFFLSCSEEQAKERVAGLEFV